MPIPRCARSRPSLPPAGLRVLATAAGVSFACLPASARDAPAPGSDLVPPFVCEGDVLAGGLREARPNVGLDDAADAASIASLPSGTEGPTPEPAELAQLVARAPSALGSLSIGTPDAGLLLNPQPLPQGPLLIVRDASDAYGTSETLAFLATAVGSVGERFCGSPRVVIGDISRADGGRLNRHASHQSGRDVDVGFYYRGGEASDFMPATARNLDLERTWALLRAFVTQTDVERIFVDRFVQRLLYAHALALGEDRAWLDDLFGRRSGGHGALIQHERRHRDHMHVRFFNPRAQEWGRLAYPLLVAAGLAPGPTLTHRVRPGETLSHLARRYGVRASAIRAANGLRGSLLRAGHRYVIPTTRVPDPGTPVVVPPRRVPPAPVAGAVEAPASP